MSSNIEKKKQLVESLAEKIKGSSSVLAVEYIGLDVSEIMDLRKELLKHNITMKVIKNNIISRAFNTVNISEMSDRKGPTALIFSEHDPTESIRIVYKFSNNHEQLKLTDAVIENKYVNAEDVIKIAKLPNREGMYSMLLSVMQAPIRNLANVIDQLREKNNN